jgi:hypothetical protein
VNTNKGGKLREIPSEKKGLSRMLRTDHTKLEIVLITESQHLLNASDCGSKRKNSVWNRRHPSHSEHHIGGKFSEGSVEAVGNKESNWIQNKTKCAIAADFTEQKISAEEDAFPASRLNQSAAEALAVECWSMVRVKRIPQRPSQPPRPFRKRQTVRNQWSGFHTTLFFILQKEVDDLFTNIIRSGWGSHYQHIVDPLLLAVVLPALPRKRFLVGHDHGVDWV